MDLPTVKARKLVFQAIAEAEAGPMNQASSMREMVHIKKKAILRTYLSRGMAGSGWAFRSSDGNKWASLVVQL